MRKVKYFFNIKPFLDELRNEGISCVKETAEKMIQCLNYFENTVLETKKFCQVIDYKLVSPLIDKINLFERWLENSGIMEIPSKLIEEYLHVISLEENSKIPIINKNDGNFSPEKGDSYETKKGKTVDTDSLLLDINSTIKQIEAVSFEIKNLEDIWNEKKSYLNNLLKGQGIVEVFGPVINEIKNKHDEIIDEEAINKFRDLISEFCTTLEERNELRYSLVFGKEKPKSDCIEKIQKQVRVHEDQLKSNAFENQNKGNLINIHGKNNKRNTSAVDQNAMKLFARWSLPIDPGL